MNSNKKLLSFLTAVSAIAPGAWSVPAQLTSPNPAALARRDLGLKGQATFYGGNVQGGACSFSTFTLPPGIFSTALAGPNWNTSGNCGGCVAVQGPKNTNADPIIAMVSIHLPKGYLTSRRILYLRLDILFIDYPQQIVDKCPDGDCTENHLDLFPDAFAAIGDPNAGVIPISWDYVECPDDKITGPLSIHSEFSRPSCPARVAKTTRLIDFDQ